jgi:hypothetical protein
MHAFIQQRFVLRPMGRMFGLMQGLMQRSQMRIGCNAF